MHQHAVINPTENKDPNTETSSTGVGSLHLTRWTTEERRTYRERSEPTFRERRL